MATNLFVTEAAESSIGDDQQQTRGTFDLGDRQATGEQQVRTTVTRVGPLGRPGYGKLFPKTFDYTSAIRDGAVPFEASSNRMLDDYSFEAVKERLFGSLGATSYNDNELVGVVNGVCLSHAKNSGSLLQPDRAIFSITVTKATGESDRRVWNYFDSVVVVLSADYRRYFRHYADYTRDLLKKILSHRGEDAYAEDIRDIDWVAADRGLSRYPYLIHDSAEACSNLSHAERLALQSSKRACLAQYNGGNPLDNPYVIRAEGVSGASGGMFGGPGATRAGGSNNHMNSPVRGELGY